MSAPRLPLMLVAFLLVAGLGLAWLLARDATGRVDDAAPGTVVAPVSARTSDPTHAAPAQLDAAGSVGAVTPDQAETAHWISGATRVYETYGDLQALAAVNLEAAEAGDAEAQYALFLALNTCSAILSQVDSAAALREKLERTLRTNHDPDWERALEAGFAACAGFAGEDKAAYGDASDWLMRAAAQDHPLAGMHYALRLHRSARARDPDLDVELREQLLAGVASGRADALPLAVAWGTSGSNISNAERIFRARALQLLACQRGYPCTPGTRWWDTRVQWAGRDAATAEELLLVQFDPDGQARTREIAAQMAAALDDGRFEDVLDPPTDVGQ